MLDDKYSKTEETIMKLKNNNVFNQDRTSTGELSNYDNHPAEQGTDLYQIELNSGILQHQQGQLSEIEHALNKIDNNGFGSCEACNGEISEERLEIMPYARYCEKCKSKANNSREISGFAI